MTFFYSQESSIFNSMNQTPGNPNWQPPDPPPGIEEEEKELKELPNAIGAFVLGIIALCCCPICCCYGNFVALVLSIIGLVLANGCLAEYQTDPWGYIEKHYKYAKSARLLNLIALIASALITLVFIIMVIMGNSPTAYNNMF